MVHVSKISPYFVGCLLMASMPSCTFLSSSITSLENSISPLFPSQAKEVTQEKYDPNLPSNRPEPETQLKAPLAPCSWHIPEGTTGSPKIVVSKSKQMASFFIGNTLVGTAAVSTGKFGGGTPTGSFHVLERDFVRYSSGYGVARNSITHEIVNENFSVSKDTLPAGCYYEPARMAYCLRYNGAYCFHQGEVTGVPESHGCIRIVPNMAKVFYEHSKIGMPIIVQP